MVFYAILRQKHLPKECDVLEIDNMSGTDEEISLALDTIQYNHCIINLPSLYGICTKKKIKCAKLKTNIIDDRALQHFNVSTLREINAENISVSLDQFFYCNVNNNCEYNMYANHDFIEGLKIIKNHVCNDDVLFEIFKKGYEPATYIMIFSVSYNPYRCIAGLWGRAFAN
jgi:hypothetical protein